jgi:plastocyanin
MSIRTRVILVLAGALVLTTALAACATGPTTVQIVETTKAQNKLDNAEATRQAVIDAGGDPDATVQVQIAGDSAAAKAIQEKSEQATAQAAEGIFLEAVGGTADDEANKGAAFEVDVPEGDALTGEIIVDIISRGAEGTLFVPEIIKVKVGSTVTWTNARKSASSSTAHEGQNDHWDSEVMFRKTFPPDPATFDHTFEILGCFTYESQFSGDTNTGAVCVVE